MCGVKYSALKTCKGKWGSIRYFYGGEITFFKGQRVIFLHEIAAYVFLYNSWVLVICNVKRVEDLGSGVKQFV